MKNEIQEILNIMYRPEVYEVVHPALEREDLSYGELVALCDFVRPIINQAVVEAIDAGMDAKDAWLEIYSQADGGDLGLLFSPNEFEEIFDKYDEIECGIYRLENTIDESEDDAEIEDAEYEKEQLENKRDEMVEELRMAA